MNRLVIKSYKLLGNSYRTKFVCFLFVGVQYCQITKLYLCGKWQIRVTKVKNIYIYFTIRKRGGARSLWRLDNLSAAASFSSLKEDASLYANLSWFWLEYFIFFNFNLILFYFLGGWGFDFYTLFPWETHHPNIKVPTNSHRVWAPVISRANVVLNRWNQESAGVAAHQPGVFTSTVLG